MTATWVSEALQTGWRDARQITGQIARQVIVAALLWTAGVSAHAVEPVAEPVAKPAAAAIVLQEVPLAGFQFHAGREVWPDLRVGDALTLVREPDNPHDANAIRVEWRGHTLGYVPRRDNVDAARLMDHGTHLSARIVRRIESRDPWARIRFEILMPLPVTP